jgi:hypothetical protein
MARKGSSECLRSDTDADNTSITFKGKIIQNARKLDESDSSISDHQPSLCLSVSKIDHLADLSNGEFDDVQRLIINIVIGKTLVGKDTLSVDCVKIEKTDGRLLAPSQ